MRIVNTFYDNITNIYGYSNKCECSFLLSYDVIRIYIRL